MEIYLLGADIVMVLAFAVKFSTIPPQIPLFYSKPWGEDRLGETWMLIILPFLLNLLFFVNKAFQRKFFPDNAFIKMMINYLNWFLIVLIPLIFIKIVFVSS